MRYEIKELGVGGILDQSITLLKNHFGLLFGITLCLYVPVTFIVSSVNLAIMPEMPAHSTPEEMLAIQQAMFEKLWITIPLIMLQLILVIPLTNAAVMHSVASEYLEYPTTVGESLRTAFRLLPPVLGTAMLMYLFIYLGLFACIIPGLFLMFRYILTSCIVVIERSSGMAALRRSKELMLSNRTRHYNTAFLLFLLLAIIQGAIVGSSAIIPQVHLRMLVSTLLQAINVLFGTTAIVVFYFSCRCTADNFDLAHLAEAVGKEAPEPKQTESKNGLGE